MDFGFKKKRDCTKAKTIFAYAYCLFSDEAAQMFQYYFTTPLFYVENSSNLICRRGFLSPYWYNE